MTHELHIMTNDGWVVTLISDTAIDLGSVAIQSIVVQPVEDYAIRLGRGDGPVMHSTYQMTPADRVRQST